MPGCAALHCKNSAKKGMRMHRFPKDVERRKKWARNTHRDFSRLPESLPSTSMKLCEVHFNEHQFDIDPKSGNCSLKPDATPTLFRLFGDEIEEIPEDELLEQLPVEHEPEDEEAQEGNAASADNGEDDDEGALVDLEALLPADGELLLSHLRNANERMTVLRRDKKLLQDQLRMARAKVVELEQNIDKFLAPDQIRRLTCKGSANPRPWTEATIKKSLQIRYMTGSKGYEYIRGLGYPFPSYRTLCRRIEDKQIAPGLNSEIISYLGIKVRSELETSRPCVLLLDEMQLRPKLEYDKGLKRYIGLISPEIARDEQEQNSLATHALAFIVRGLTVHWKQVIGYLLTGSSTNPKQLWKCIKDVIHRLTEENLDVRAVITDMGPNNTGVWGLLGVHAIKCQTTPSCPHPEDPSKRLYWLADSPHLLKNIRAAMQSQSIYLPDDVVAANNLPTNEVSLKHIEKLIKLQEGETADRGLVLAPKLVEKLLVPSQFEKMRVHLSAKVLSRTTAQALRFCAEEPEIKGIGNEVLATSWFIEQVNNWFDLMNSRTNGIDKHAAGDQKIEQLKSFADLMKGLRFGKRGWKPIQTGVLLSTTSVIELHKDLVKNGDIIYLLTSRLTTDPVENLFSQIRGSGDTDPGPVRFRYAIRMIVVSQFLHVPRNSNYAEDDAQHLVDFLKLKKKTVTLNNNEIDDIASEFESEELTALQEFGLYKTAGWAVFKSMPLCNVCMPLMKSNEPLDNCPSGWTECISRGFLTHPSYASYKTIYTAEEVFNTEKHTLLQRKDVKQYLIEKIIKAIDEETKKALHSNCHDLLHLLVNKFVSLRVHILAEDRSRALNPAISHSSKSAYMRTAAENHKRAKLE